MPQQNWFEQNAPKPKGNWFEENAPDKDPTHGSSAGGRYTAQKTGQPVEPLGVRESFEQHLAPQDEAGSGIVGRLKNAVKGTAAGLIVPVLHPIKTALSMAESAPATTPYGVPTIGPTGNIQRDVVNIQQKEKKLAEQEQRGKEELEEFKKHPVYDIAGQVGPPLVTHLAGEAIDMAHTPGKFKESVRKMVNVDRKAIMDNVRKEAEKAHEAAEDIKQHNTDLDVQRTRRGELEKNVQQRTESVNARRQEIQTKAFNVNKEHWDNLRKTLGEKETDIGPLQDVVEFAAKKADPTSSPIFKSILRTDAPEIRPVTIDGAKIGPENSRYAELYQATWGEPPPIEDELGRVDFDRLQRWYTFLNDKMFAGGRLEPGTRQALKLTRNSVNELMQKIAKENGAEDELQAARQSHQNYQEAFGGQKNKPRSAAERNERRGNPKAYEARKEQEDVARVAKYDPRYAADYAEQVKARHQLETFPTEKAIRGSLKPPNELPVIDPTQIRENIIRAAATRWTTTSQYQVRRIAQSAIAPIVGLAVGSYFGHPAFGTAVGAVAMEMMPKIAASVIESDKVLNWLKETPIADVNALRTLPHADQLLIMDSITQIAKAAAERGKPVTIGKDAKYFMSPKSLAIIAAANARPNTPSEAKKRAEEVKRGNQ